MPQAPMSIEMMRHAVMIVRKHGSVSRAAREEDIPYSTLQTRYAKAVQKGLTEADSEADPTHLELHNLRQRCEALEKQVRRQSEDEAFYHWVRNELFKMKSSDPTPPGWVHSPGKMAKTSPGTPFLALGDWHAGEYVDPGQVDGLNEYDMSIFHTRAKRVIDTTVDLLEHHMVRPDYPGIVVALLGDMVSGDIHQELKETNELPTIPTVLDVCGVLQRSLEYLADRFGRVHVVCVVGNHGRNTVKMQAKNRTATSFDWLLYKMVEMQFQNDKRVTFQIPDGADARLRVHNHDYIITHGDQFRGGDGIIGPLGPLCVTPETPVLLSDLSYKPASDIAVNDRIVGFEEEADEGERRRFQESVVTDVQDLELECIEITTDDGCVTTASLEHPWLIRSGTSHAWMRTDRLRLGSRIMSLGRPCPREESWEAGYLAGVLDGEGHVEKKGRLKFSQHDNACFRAARMVLDKMGIPYNTRESGHAARGYEECYQTVLNPGRENSGMEHLRLFSILRPPRLLSEFGRRLWDGRGVQIADETIVTGLRYVGVQRVKGFTTSTRTFIANGMLTHNTRGDYKKRLRESTVDQTYDTMVTGHFHRLITLSQLITNGSLVGYNEFAFLNNMPYEPPQQALWLTNPNYGITFSLPVYADEPKSRKPSEWIKVPQ